MSGLDAEAEQAIKQACEVQDHDLAATRALEAYAPEILSFLIARLRAESEGEEAFSIFAEDLWKAIPSFEFRCSVRGYLYTLARNAANRYASSPHNRRERNLSITGNASRSALMAHARSVTHVYQRTEVKDKIRALREQLPQEDQTLLLLHVDRGLPWSEIAMIMHEQGETLDNAALERESARLRKRFERVKAELKRLATESGLLKR